MRRVDSHGLREGSGDRGEDNEESHFLEKAQDCGQRRAELKLKKDLRVSKDDLLPFAIQQFAGRPFSTTKQESLLPLLAVV